MNRVEHLLKKYTSWVAAPWARGLAGPQKVWCVVYEPADERRLRLRLEDFGTATQSHGHGWRCCDVTDAFAEWMSALDYRDSYFESPEDLNKSLLGDFLQFTARKVVEQLQAVGDSDVVAVAGIGSLFGFAFASELMKAVDIAIRGRMLIFFPGVYDNNNYRLFDARDGWNYLAVPITVGEGELGA